MHTKGPWKYKNWLGNNYAIIPCVTSSNPYPVIAIMQAPGAGGPISDEERFSNIRLVTEAPNLFDALLKAHDLSLDGKHEEAREVMLYAVEQVTQDQLPDNY